MLPPLPQACLNLTPGRVLSATERAELWRVVTSSDRWQALTTEAKELDRLAVPLYKEMLCSNPFYKAREHDSHFWSQYVGSRVVEARELVALRGMALTLSPTRDHGARSFVEPGRA